MLYAKDIMTEDVVSVRQHCTLYDAVELLLEHQVSGLPVVDNAGIVIGIITEFALLVLTYDKTCERDNVGWHMTRQVCTVDEQTLLSDVADIFILNRFRRVPVVCEGKLVGIISRRDLMRAAHLHDQEIARPEVLTVQRRMAQRMMLGN